MECIHKYEILVLRDSPKCRPKISPSLHFIRRGVDDVMGMSMTCPSFTGVSHNKSCPPRAWGSQDSHISSGLQTQRHSLPRVGRGMTKSHACVQNHVGASGFRARSTNSECRFPSPCPLRKMLQELMIRVTSSLQCRSSVTLWDAPGLLGRRFLSSFRDCSTPLRK
jgi:hypothetical protein